MKSEDGQFSYGLERTNQIEHPQSRLHDLGLEQIVPLEPDCVETISVKDKEGAKYKLSSLRLKTEDTKEKFDQEALFLALWKGEEDNPTPVGYLSFSLPNENTSEAICNTSFYACIKEDYVWPHPFSNLKDVFGGRLTGIRILPKYEGLGLGNLIWGVGLGVLEAMNRKVCFVRRDSTIAGIEERDQRLSVLERSTENLPSGSFYSSHNEVQVVRRGNKSELMMLTRPTIDQAVIIKNLVLAHQD